MFPRLSALVGGLALLCAPSVLAKQAVLTPPPTVAAVWNYEFTSFIELDFPNLQAIKIPEGHRITAGFLGGNWTAPDGSLLATIIPGNGGEHGTLDSNGIVHMMVRYTIQFIDGKFGYVVQEGHCVFGKPSYNVKLITILETDSPLGLKYTRKSIHSDSTFEAGHNFLISGHYVPQDRPSPVQPHTEL